MLFFISSIVGKYPGEQVLFADRLGCSEKLAYNVGETRETFVGVFK